LKCGQLRIRRVNDLADVRKLVFFSFTIFLVSFVGILYGCCPSLNYLLFFNLCNSCLPQNISMHVFRGVQTVQYVYCMMHKCIVVKIGGRITRKLVKKTLKFYENREGNVENRGKTKFFSGNRGEYLNSAEIGGKVTNLESMTVKSPIIINFCWQTHTFF